MIFIVLLSVVQLILVRYIIKAPGVALVGVWCMYAIEQWAQATDVLFIRYNSLINIVTGGLVVFGLLVKVFRYRFVFKDYPKIALPIMLLFLYSFISIFWTQRIDLSYDVWEKYWQYVVIFLILSPLLQTKYDEYRLLLNIFIFIGGIVVYSLLFHVEWFHRRIVFEGSRFHNELLGNPLAIAQMAGYLFFVCIFMLRKNTIGRMNFLFLSLKLLIGGICLILIIKSGSRGQLLGLILTIMLFLPLTYKANNIKSIMLISMFSLLMVGVVIWGLDEFWRESSRWSTDEMESSIGGRLDNAFVLLSHWYKDPLTLLFGLGNSASYNPKIIGIYPHFVPLEILGEEGVIGFCIYIFILLGIVGIGYRTYKASQNDIEDRLYFSILLSMVFYSFILSLKQGSLLGNMEFFMAAIILGKYEVILKNKKKAIQG